MLKNIQTMLKAQEDQLAAANTELESLRQVPERIVSLSDRIKEDEEAAALLQMEETRRATGRDITKLLPSSLLAHTGSFMEYRQAIAEVAVISKEFYSACAAHKKCFKKNPLVNIQIQGANNESCNGMYHGRTQLCLDHGTHSPDKNYMILRHTRNFSRLPRIGV